ncbi:MAG TPA: hypothetical protein V6D25_26090 [Leptolyngbyaceae cyanobacterium]
MLTQSSIELWDLEKPFITERSRLHHLKPIGVGTAMVESLTGYIARLADSHSVFPGILISREIAPFLNDSKTSTDEFSQQGFLSKEELEWQTWVAEVLGELIAAIPYLKTPIPKEKIAKSLSIAIDMVSEGNLAAFASLLGLPKNTVWMWKNGKAIPQIDLLLRICYFLRVTLLNFLTSEDIASCIKITIKPPYQRSRKPRISPKLFDSEQIQDALLAVVRSDEIPPPAMREVALQLGYDRRTILQHFPDLCHAISAKHLSYRKSLRLENIELSCKEVQQIAIRLCNEEIYPTENLVSQSMTKPGYLRYKEVRATLQQVQTNLSG